MRLLDRYLLREFVAPLGYCLAGFSIFWIGFDYFSDLEKFKQLRLAEIAGYYAFRSLGILVFIFPIVLLLAVLYALTNHNRHYELTAIRAAGVSLWRLCLPYLMIGLIASVGFFAVNEWCTPRAEAEAQAILDRHDEQLKDPRAKRLAHDLAFSNSRAGRKWLVRTYNTETYQMSNITVVCSEPGGEKTNIQARWAVRNNGTWIFHDVTESRSPAQSDALTVPLLKTNVLAMPQFGETPEEIQSEIRINERLSRPKLEAGTDLPLSEILNYLRLHPDPQGNTKSWIYTKLNERLAEPWTNLVVVLIAIPFGAASGRRNVFIGVASALSLCFAYYVLQRLAEAFGLHGTLPPWLAAWLPNLAFAAAGAFMTSRVR